MNRLFLLGVAMSLLVSCGQGTKDTEDRADSQPVVKQVVRVKEVVVKDKELIRQLAERKAEEKKLQSKLSSYSVFYGTMEKFVKELRVIRARIKLYDCDFMIEKLRTDLVPKRDSLMRLANSASVVSRVMVQQVFSDFLSVVRREICADKTDDDFKGIEPKMITVQAMSLPVDTVDGIFAVTADGKQVMLSESNLNDYADDFEPAVYKVYNRFAESTGGFMGFLSKSEHIDQILKKVKEHMFMKTLSVDQAFDVVFVVDLSKSMSEDWADVKTGVARFMNGHDDKLKWSLVGFSNNSAKSGVSVENGSSDAITDALSKVELVDEPLAELKENVYSGLLSAVHQIKWRADAKRIVILIGDALPKNIKKNGVEINRNAIAEIFREQSVTLYPVMIMD